MAFRQEMESFIQAATIAGATNFPLDGGRIFEWLQYDFHQEFNSDCGDLKSEHYFEENGRCFFTTKGFKVLGMKALTPRGDQMRMYYANIENTVMQWFAENAQPRNMYTRV